MPPDAPVPPPSPAAGQSGPLLRPLLEAFHALPAEGQLEVLTALYLAAPHVAAPFVLSIRRWANPVVRDWVDRVNTAPWEWALLATLDTAGEAALVEALAAGRGAAKDLTARPRQ